MPIQARATWCVVAFAVVAGLSPARSAQAGAWTLKPGEYYTELLGSWSSSDFYHDANGTKQDLVGGGLWEERSLLSYTELGWKKRTSFVLGIPALSVTRRFGAAAGGRTVPTTTGLADALVGFRWRLAAGRTGAALELDWKPPLGYERSRWLTHADSVAAGDASGNGDSLDFNRARQLGTPVLGEGQNDVTLSLQLGRTIGSRAFVEASGGYRYRFETPKDQIVAGADLGIWLSRTLMLAGRYTGEMSSASDLAVTLPGGQIRATQNFTRHRAGPMLIYRVDDRMDLVLSTLHTVSAKNALHSDEIYLGVAFRQTKLNRLQGFTGNASNP